MKLFLVTALVMMPSAWAYMVSDPMDKGIMDFVDFYNLYGTCWGEESLNKWMQSTKEAIEECSAQYASDPVVARRRRRRELTEEQVEKLVTKFSVFKSMRQNNMDVLVCVLQKHKILNEEGNVDVEALISFYNEQDKVNAAADPAWLERLTTGMRDCYDVSESWPQAMLDRHPYLQRYGRQHIFVACQKKIEEELCYQYRVKTVLEGLHEGSWTAEDSATVGLPEDMYEAAYTLVKAKAATKSVPMKFVDAVLLSRAQFL